MLKRIKKHEHKEHGNTLKHEAPVVQDLFYVFLNNFEIAIFLLFSKLFINFFLHYESVIFKKREPLIKLFFTAFIRFKLRYKMSGVVLKCAKKRLKGESSRNLQ